MWDLISLSDIEDLKYAAFGTYSSNFAVNTLTSYDWSDRDDASQGRKLSPFVLSAGSGPSSAASVLQKQEPSFGSSENITMASLSKGKTFTSEDALPDPAFPAFASFKDMIPPTGEQKEFESGDYQDFTRQDLPASERKQEATCSSPASSNASHDTPKECSDDFGEFQSEKPKISKFDFLVANTQSKMKSSEEMIRSELATFDLSVQGESNLMPWFLPLRYYMSLSVQLPSSFLLSLLSFLLLFLCPPTLLHLSSLFFPLLFFFPLLGMESSESQETTLLILSLILILDGSVVLWSWGLPGLLLPE